MPRRSGKSSRPRGLFDYGPDTLIVVDFETGSTGQAQGVQAVDPPTNLIVSDAGPKRSGSYALHAVCDAADPPLLGHNHRSEILIGQPVLGEWWYGGSTYVPSDWSNDDDSCSNCGTTDHYHLLMQWVHQNATAGVPLRMQPLELRIKDSTIELMHHYGTIGQGLVSTVLWSDDVDNYKGVWTDWVVHANWTQDANARFIRIWKNGAQIVNWTGTTSYADGGNVYFKAGLTYDVDQSRDVWLDEIRMAGSAANYNTVAPRS